jgi:hypothetical protein
VALTVSRSISVLFVGIALGACSSGEPEGNIDSVDAEQRVGLRFCSSTDECEDGMYCTTEDGDCAPPLGCAPHSECHRACFGVCRPLRPVFVPLPTPPVLRPPVETPPLPHLVPPPRVAPGEPCGRTTCGDGEVCCNASCGICVPPGGACLQMICSPDR